MDPLFAKAVTWLKSAAGSVRKQLKPLMAEKSAGSAPEKIKTIDQATFDGVLGRLVAADPADAIFARLTGTAMNKIFSPEMLRTQNVQDWLAIGKVQQDLKDVASAKLLGSTVPPHAVERLESSYCEIAYASRPESSPIVEAVIAMLVTAVTARADGTGTAALVIASSKENVRHFEEINAKFDRLLPDTAKEAFVLQDLVQLDAPTVKNWHEAFAEASRDLLEWPATLGNGSHIPRLELSRLLEIAQSKNRGAVALLGLPGTGKSALLARLGQELSINRDTSVLAIKGDILDAGIASEKDLQQDLRLPELPSIMLRRLALVGPVVLLVDQLDALAGHIDIRTGRLSVLLNLIKSVSGFDNLYVFVSCRTFEFTHDMRLSRIDAESITLEPPSWEQLVPILEAHGVTPISWNSDAREVVRVPQHLNTYLKLKSSGIDEPFSNYTAMLESLWAVRVLNVPGGAKAAALAFEVAETMAAKEALWLASARFDGKADELNFLVSAGILSKSDKGAFGFSHQTVFEHVLARSFTKNDGQLSTYVLARTDSLFLRPKLWAALAYLRNAEPETYESELSTIWDAPGLRKHLRYLLIEFMGSQTEPTDKEEVLLAGACEQQELLPIVLKAIAGGKGWFERFGSNVIAKAMVNEAVADLCVHLLACAWSFSGDKVEILVRSIWLPLYGNDRRTIHVLQEAPNWTPRLVDIAETVVKRFDFHASYADYFVSVVGAVDSNVAILLLRFILDREWAKRKAEALQFREIADKEIPVEGERDVVWYMEHDPTRPLNELLNDVQQWGTVPELAARSPSYFIEIFWPWYKSAFGDLLEVVNPDDPYFGFSLSCRVDLRLDGNHNLPQSSIFEAIVIALEKLAETSPQKLLQWIEKNEGVALTPVQRLIAHALGYNPSQTADHALNFLLSDERRYFLGSLSDSSGTTLALISACAPFWGSDQLMKFVSRVKAFSPTRPKENSWSPENIREWHRTIRRTRIRLLRALPAHACPVDVQRQLEEDKRALPHQPYLDDVEGGWIGSPITATQMACASESDILHAFQEIHDGFAWDHPKHLMRGGNIQLSREFAEFAKASPTRAIRILECLDPRFGQRAAGYTIETLAESYDPEELMVLIVRLEGRGFGSDEFRASVARAVEQLTARDVKVMESILDVLEGWLSLDGNEDEKVPIANNTLNQEADTSTDSGSEEESFLLCGDRRIIPLPGGDFPIVSALISARLVRKESLLLIQLLRRYRHTSQDARTWEALARRLTRLPALDPQEGPSFIGEVLSMPQLDGTVGAANLMGKTYRVAFAEFSRNLRRWRDSPDLVTRKGYGELVALIALVNKDAHEARQWLDEIIVDVRFADARTGAAATAVQILWPELGFRSASTDLIIRLLERNEVAVWRQVFVLFRLVSELENEPDTVRLLNAISNNIDQAPSPTEPYVIERLGNLLPCHAKVVANIASHLIQKWRNKLANAGSTLAYAGQEMVELAISLHRTEGTKLEGLQMFEQLIEIDAYQAREILDELDHRLRSAGSPVRRRLPRRSGRRRARSKG